MHHYAHRHLSLAKSYVRTHATNVLSHFIEIPLVLAFATLDALARGETKLSRAAVNSAP